MSEYSLQQPAGGQKQSSAWKALKRLWPMMASQKWQLLGAFAAILCNTFITLAAPYIIGRAVDESLARGVYDGVPRYAAMLFGIFVLGAIAMYLQPLLMGAVGQGLLFRLRNSLFKKLQDLPVAFFNQNKSGDLISRVNNDTDKLNQFFSQSLMQFVGMLFMMTGVGIFLLALDSRLGLAALVPAVVALVLSRLLSPWVRRQNAKNLKETGGLSAEIQESLQNFKVVVAFNRRDEFRRKIEEVNASNYKAAVGAGIANTVFVPIYGFAGNIAMLTVLTYGVWLISTGTFTVGLLVSYLTYVTRFYDPLRQIATIWGQFQSAMAGWDRVAAILRLESNLTVVPAATAEDTAKSAALMEFHDVAFHYPDGKEVLHGINFTLERGKTYALVGPTGGGKTTTASLMARLFDPSKGTVLFGGRDIRSFDPSDRTHRIGFILQEPFLFGGTLKENLLYGNDRITDDMQLQKALDDSGLQKLLAAFEKGLETPITGGGDAISLGQRQLIAFMRAVLRDPDLLILDEATANIDTVTEQLLEDVLRALPKKTTKVIIAHRLNTIENADEIFFVNAGEITRAGSIEHAVEMLLEGKRES